MSKWVHIITAQNIDGSSGMVLAHAATQREAQTIINDLRRIGAEQVADSLQTSGPVRSDDYPIGKILELEDDES